MDDHTKPSEDSTGDRDVPSGADREPTPEEERLADEAAREAPDVSEEYSHLAKIGANAKGEGRPEV
jgi:hypothetical protein